jgi:hypothetical protein
VAAANFWSVHVLNGRNGVPLTCQNTSCGTQTSLFAWGTLKSTPAVGDIDNDGKLDLVIGGAHIYNGGKGMLYAWTNFAGLLNSPSGSQPAFSAPWPMFRGNPAHTGIAPGLHVATSGFTAIARPTDSARSFRVYVTEEAGSAISWTATDDRSWLSISPSNGTTPDAITITVDPFGQSIGSYDGTVSLTSPVGSSKISVKMLVVNQLYENFLPLVMSQ